MLGSLQKYDKVFIFYFITVKSIVGFESLSVIELFLIKLNRPKRKKMRKSVHRKLYTIVEIVIKSHSIKSRLKKLAAFYQNLNYYIY